jgi:hypothetical protein
MKKAMWKKSADDRRGFIGGACKQRLSRYQTLHQLLQLRIEMSDDVWEWSPCLGLSLITSYDADDLLRQFGGMGC